MAPSQWPPGDPGLGEFPRGPGPLPPGPVDLGLPPGSATQCVFLIPLCLWAGLALAGRSAFHNRLISLHTGPDGRVLPGAGGGIPGGALHCGAASFERHVNGQGPGSWKQMLCPLPPSPAGTEGIPLLPRGHPGCPRHHPRQKRVRKASSQNRSPLSPLTTGAGWRALWLSPTPCAWSRSPPSCPAPV